MWNAFLSSFRAAAKALFRTLLLLSFCGAAAFVIVYPLWKFGTAAPRLYTAFVLLSALLCILFFAVKKIRTAPWRKTLQILLAAVIVIGASAIAVAAVLAGFRILAIPAVILAPIACMLVSAVLSRPQEQSRSRR